MKNSHIETILNASLLLLLLSLFPQVTYAAAKTSEEKGLKIAREADRRDAGFKDMSANMTMTLRNRHGKESIRKIRLKGLEVEGDGDKSLSIFDNPRDIRGTAFLTYSHKIGDDDQWLYLPALKRVKRISSRNKSGSFMGSEFAYEDIASQEVEKYTYKWIRNEVYDEKECFVIERYPVDKKNSGYTRQIAWIDKAEYRELMVEFYDRKNALLKTLTSEDFRKYKNKFWRPDVLYMVNHQTGKSTSLEFANYTFGIGLMDRDFTKNSLRRAR